MPTPASSKNLVFTLINQTFLSINSTTPELTAKCWLCYHSSPPFYEGAAIPGNFSTSNDTYNCRWERASWEGLTLAQVVSNGTCITNTLLKIPRGYAHLCQEIFSIEQGPQYIVPPNDTWWACLDGLTPCVYNLILQEHGFCVLVKVIPRLIYYRSDEFFHIWEQSSDPSLPKRSRREPTTAVTIAVLLGLGAVGAGTDISSLVLSNSRYHVLSATID